jgi:hypothetical protein
MDREQVTAELRDMKADFHALVAEASADDLRRRSNGTRWTNRQLLYHMVFGYMIVRTLQPLVHGLGRLNRSRRFAAVLDAGRRPFHVVNYLGSVVGGQLLTPTGTERLLGCTINALQRQIAAESEQTLALTMHFPTSWDPYFRSTMTVLDVYHYGTEHYQHHRQQLSFTTRVRQ